MTHSVLMTEQQAIILRKLVRDNGDKQSTLYAVLPAPDAQAIEALALAWIRADSAHETSGEHDMRRY